MRRPCGSPGRNPDKPSGIHPDQQEGLALDEREGTPAPPPGSVSRPPMNDLNGGHDFLEAFGRGCRLQCPIGIGQRDAEPRVILPHRRLHTAPQRHEDHIDIGGDFLGVLEEQGGTGSRTFQLEGVNPQKQARMARALRWLQSSAVCWRQAGVALSTRRRFAQPPFS